MNLETSLEPRLWEAVRALSRATGDAYIAFDVCARRFENKGEDIQADVVATQAGQRNFR